jgi:hypothetical protein
MGFLALQKAQFAADSIQFAKILNNFREDWIFLFQVLFQIF